MTSDRELVVDVLRGIEPGGTHGVARAEELADLIEQGEVILTCRCSGSGRNGERCVRPAAHAGQCREGVHDGLR